jgi:hypothetical protein
MAALAQACDEAVVGIAVGVVGPAEVALAPREKRLVRSSQLVNVKTGMLQSFVLFCRVLNLCLDAVINAASRILCPPMGVSRSLLRPPAGDTPALLVG